MNGNNTGKKWKTLETRTKQQEKGVLSIEKVSEMEDSGKPAAKLEAHERKRLDMLSTETEFSVNRSILRSARENFSGEKLRSNAQNRLSRNSR